MGILIGLVLIILLYVFNSILFIFVKNELKLFFGYKKYEYTKILSYGIRNEYMQHKTDEEALEYYKDFEFVNEIEPNIRRIKPNN